MVYWYGFCWRLDRQLYELIYNIILIGLFDEQCVEKFLKCVVDNFGMIVFYFVGKDESGNLNKNLWFLFEGNVFFFFDENNFFFKFFLDVSIF